MAVALAGAVIGFATSTVAGLAFMVGPFDAAYSGSAVHAPAVADGTAHSAEELADAQRILSNNQALLAGMQGDARWEDPAQRQGMIWALESTLAVISAQEAEIESLQPAPSH